MKHCMVKNEYLRIAHLSRKDIARIFAKIQVNPITGCWEWTGAFAGSGYGKVWHQGRLHYTHRLMYAWLIGPLPTGKTRDIPNIDHVVCDNIRCCNPAHVRLVSQQSNILRGHGSSAVNSRKVWCKNGHVLPRERNGKGQRICGQCLYEWRHTEQQMEKSRKRSLEYYYNSKGRTDNPFQSAMGA